MRLNSDAYQEFNQAPSKDLRLVIVIDFPAPVYLASHDDIPNLPANHIADVLRNTSAVSQELKLQQARSIIGNFSAELLDAGGALSDLFRNEDVAGNGLRGRRIQLYRGGAGMDWADFRLELTQQIDKSVSYDAGRYKLTAQDIQRELRKDVFDNATTTLAADFLIGDSNLTLHDASGFLIVPQETSFSLYPGANRYYVKLKYQDSFEIVAATGKAGNVLTGVTRGLFGTTEIDHIVPVGSNSDSSIEVEEYIYLEMPAPAFVYAVLTGEYPDGTALPAHFGLGIDPVDVDVGSFNTIGTDWFDPADYSKGLIFRFDGLTRQDGKAFIERELLLGMGAHLAVGADGKLRLRRTQSVQRTSDYAVELNDNNVMSWGALEHDLGAIRNVFEIKWAWSHDPREDKPRFFRKLTLADADSISRHGVTQTEQLAFKGLNSQRHTASTLRSRFDALRDLSAGAPLKIQLTLLPSMDDIEVGDIVRARTDKIRDYQSDDTLDRSFLVVRKSVDQKSGRVIVRLEGSSTRASAIADPLGDAAAELPDGWYTTNAVDINTRPGVNIVGGVLQSDVTVASSENQRGRFYHIGDLTIPVGVTLTFLFNVEFRVRGVLQILGKIDVDDGLVAGVAGYLGTTFGGRRIIVGSASTNQTPGLGAERVEGDNHALPPLEIVNNAGALEGIPAEMRGSGGGDGGGVVQWNPIDQVWDPLAIGGVGGRGGGSLVLVARGVVFGAGGEIDLSGEDGSVGAYSQPGNQYKSGSGGGGAPGTCVILIDGVLNSIPLLNQGEIVAKYGISPQLDGDPDVQGKASTELDLGNACARALFVPVSRDPYPSYSVGDGAGAVSARVENSNGVAWNRQPNGGAWDPVATETELHVYFTKDGVDVARIGREVQRDVDGLLTHSAIANQDGDLNAGRVTVSQVGSGTRAMTVTFRYEYNGEIAEISQPLVAVVGGESSIDLRLSKHAAVVQVDSGFNGNLGPASGQMILTQGDTNLMPVAVVSYEAPYQSTWELNTSENSDFPGPKGAFQMTSISGQDGAVTLRADVAGITKRIEFDATANVVAAPGMSAYIPGGDINESLPNGTQQTLSQLTVVVENSPGPFSFDWEVTATLQGNAGSAVNDLTKTTNFESTGIETTNQWRVRCKVTDNMTTQVVYTNERTIEVVHEVPVT